MPSSVLIAATTSAGNSEVFATAGQPAGITLYSASALVSTEIFNVQVSPDGVNYWQDLWLFNNQITLSSINTAVTVNGPGWFRVVKPVTASTVSVHYTAWPY